jgi:hypothetical protein
MENIWSSSCGRIELNLSAEHAARGYHSGQCDLDIMALRILPEISRQLSALDRGLVYECLKEYGAWDYNDLSDHEANLDRLLWIACGDLIDGQFSEE